MNLTKNYLVTKSVSLIVVDYFVVMFGLRVQAAMEHCLGAAERAVDYLLPNWMRSRQHYFARRQLLLAASVHKEIIIINCSTKKRDQTHDSFIHHSKFNEAGKIHENKNSFLLCEMCI